MRRAWGAVVVAACVVVGCSSGTGGSSESPPEDTEASGVTDVDDTVGPSDPDVQPSATSIADAAPSTDGADELVEIAGITRITVTTPASGNGEHPLFAWSPVAGAESYALTLTASDGQTYWAWSGPESEIYLGGLLEPPPIDSSGPYLYEPMVLQVVGIDGEGYVIAASESTPVAP